MSSGKKCKKCNGRYYGKECQPCAGKVKRDQGTTIPPAYQEQHEQRLKYLILKHSIAEKLIKERKIKAQKKIKITPRHKLSTKCQSHPGKTGSRFSTCRACKIRVLRNELYGIGFCKPCHDQVSLSLL